MCTVSTRCLACDSTRLTNNKEDLNYDNEMDNKTENDSSVVSDVIDDEL